MSKLLGLNASNVLETLKSVDNHLITHSKVMGLNDNGGQSQIRTDNSGNITSHTTGQYIATPFTLTDGQTTIFQLDSSGNLKVREQPTQILQVLEEPTIAAGAFGGIIDCRNMKSIRIWGNTSTLSVLTLQFASTNSPYDWQNVETIMPLEYYGSYQVSKVIETPPPFMRVNNLTGSVQGYSIKVSKIN